MPIGLLDIDPRTKPDAGAELDAAHPHAQGMFVWWLLNEASGPLAVDVSRYGNHGTATATGVTRAAGPGLKFSGSGQVQRTSAVGLPGNPGGATAAPWALEIWAATTSTVSLAAPFSFGGTSSVGAGDVRAILQYGGSAPNNHIYFFGDAADWDTGLAWKLDGAPHQYLFASAGTSGTAAIRLYIDGLLVATGTPAASLAGLGGATIRADSQTFAAAFPGTLYSARGWAADVGPLVPSLYAEPYAAILAPTTRRFFVPAAGGGGNRRRRLICSTGG